MSYRTANDFGSLNNEIFTNALACPTPIQVWTRFVGSPGELIPGQITRRPFEKFGTFGTVNIVEYSTMEALDGGVTV
jgi:hypothetical protein